MDTSRARCCTSAVAPASPSTGNTGVMMKAFRLLFVGLASFALGTAQAQGGFPNRPIKIVVANPPGGQTDVATRVIAQEMSSILKQPVIIVNKPGAYSNP